MADDFSTLATALQDGLGEWLAAHAGVRAAFGTNPVRVLTAADERAVMPYLQTGEDDFLPADTQGQPARIATSRVHVWTREPGFTLCKQIGGGVLAALSVTGPDGANNGLTAAGYELVYGVNVLERYMRDPAANVRHGVLDFELRFVPAA